MSNAAFNISGVSYQIDQQAETTPPVYNLTFEIPSAGAPAQLRYFKIGDPALDSGLHTPGSQDYSYTFTGLSELEVEGSWLVEWKTLPESDTNDGVLTIPTSAITSSPPNDGLEPIASEIEVTLDDDSSPYLAKQVHISDFAMSLETFSGGAEYVPLKTYTIPRGVRVLTLEVNDYIPSSYLGARENWIKYFIVIGEEEYQITPRNRSGSYPVIYHINSPLLGPVRTARELNNEGFIDTDRGRVTQVGVNVRLGRPEGQTSSTPIIFGYKLKYIEYETA